MGTADTAGRVDDPSATVTIHRSDGAVVGRCTLHRVRPGLDLVAALACVQMLARRYACHMRLSQLSRELHDIITLLGLAEVLDLEDRDSRVESVGQPEHGEQPRVEEVVQPGDTLS